MINRRDFLNGVLATGTTLAASALPATDSQQPRAALALPGRGSLKDERGKAASVVDFRFAPVKRQTAFCFPDDPHKSLVSETGQLLYGYKFGSSTLACPLKVGFTRVEGAHSRIERGMVLIDGEASRWTAFWKT